MKNDLNDEIQLFFCESRQTDKPKKQKFVVEGKKKFEKLSRLSLTILFLIKKIVFALN